jgi:hypothetical protein
MIRRLGTPSGAYNLPKLRVEAATAWPKLLGVNEVNDGTAHIGFYFEDAEAPTQAAVDTLIGAHTATPLPPTVEETAFAAAVTQLRATFNTTRTAAQINNSIDALTVLMRRAFRELQ